MSSMKEVIGNPWFKLLMLVIVLLAMAYGVYALRGILLPFALALVLAYIINPAVNWLEAHRIPRWVSSPGIVLAALLVFLAGILFLVLDIQSAVSKAVEKAPEGQLNALGKDKEPEEGQNKPAEPPEEQEIGSQEWLDQQLKRAVNYLPQQYRPLALRASRSIVEYVSRNLQEIAESTGAILGQIVKSAGDFIIGLLMAALALVLTVYMLIAMPQAKKTTLDLLPARYKVDILRITGRIDRDLRHFFRGQLLVVLILVVMYLAGFLIIGVPYAVPVAIIGGVGELIPFFGTMMGIIVGLIASAVTYGFDYHMLLVILVFAVGQSLESGFISPKILGGQVGMNPVFVILAVFVFGEMFGFIGALFAVPLASVVRVLGLEILQRVGRPTEIELPFETPGAAEGKQPANE